MTQPLLSIITINFNHAKGLQRTINSVTSQTFEDLEYLIIDGASKDESTAVIEKNADKIDHWVSESDTGIYNAMNKGIKAAKGQYLLFLNSGDVLSGRTALADFIGHHDFKGDIIYGDYKFEEGEKVYPDTLTPIFFMRSSLPHQSTLFKSTVFDEMGLYDESYQISADRAFYAKCFASGNVQFTHLSYPLAVFDLSGMSNDPKHLQKKLEEDERLLRAAFGERYDGYMAQLQEQRAMSEAKYKGLMGIFRRINRKFRKR
ncbi:glycosyltransferase family 2 protein [Sungkyunkwania multivorans]|uniref:Glycosyltransferase family 2 protein n=1 Tax=Sungkyunkwania multivorans TaxID=1173618 RepID=A0ABW3D4X1_9FLAO